MSFPCNKCGLCCRRVSGIQELNRGDGTCRHLDEKTNLCTIYDQRPDMCRVDLMISRSDPKFSRDDYYKLTAAVCRSWQMDAGFPPEKLIEV